MRLRVVIVEDEDGFSAFCPEIPGCMTQGGTMEETKANIIEAIKLNLEHLVATGQPLPTLPIEKSDGDTLIPAAARDILATKFADLDRQMVANRSEYDLLLA